MAPALLALLAQPIIAAPASFGADTVRLIRSAGLDPAECYRVRDLSFSKEDIRLYFNDGYLIFSKPIKGERLSAVFSADVEGGDGELLLLPPYRGERQSLAKFTGSPNMDEHFRAALLISTDGSAQALLDRIDREKLGRKIPEMGALLAGQWSPVLANVQSGFELRTVQDLLTPPRSRQGLLFAAIAGRQLGNFDLLYDGQAREQIMAGRLAERDGQSAYDVWTSFAARRTRTGGFQPASAAFATDRFHIDAALDANLRMKATVGASIKTGVNPLRALPFNLARAMQVTAARIDGVPAELLFRDSARRRALSNDENDPFLLIAPEDLAAGSLHEIEFDEEGSVITPAGKDVYYVGARANWYPRGSENFALYDLKFQYPKRLMLVTAGDVVEDHAEGEWRITHRVTPAPIRLAGFNLGDYQKITGASLAFHVEVYGNRGLETALQPKLSQTVALPQIQAQPPAQPNARPLIRVPPPPAHLEIPLPPDPLARLRSVAADVTSALQFFSTLFGPPSLKSLTVSPIPGTFGQGFPGLIYLSTLAYLDPNERPLATRGPREQLFYSDLMEAHEVSHQWWGDLVTSAGYQDEWLMEALASYSALLFLEKKKGPKALEAVLEDYRDGLVKKDADGHTVDSAGPITWGFRLKSTGSPDAWRAITYDKGAWIFHMLRRRLGDAQFFKMLAELRRHFDSRPLSTADLRALVKDYIPARMSQTKLDAFFDNWIYSTEIPALKLRYTVKGVPPSVKLSGQVEQSGVEDDFAIEAPVEIQFAKGAPQTIWVETSNGGASFSATLKQLPLHVSIPVGTGVLAKRQ